MLVSDDSSNWLVQASVDASAVQSQYLAYGDHCCAQQAFIVLTMSRGGSTSAALSALLMLFRTVDIA